MPVTVTVHLQCTAALRPVFKNKVGAAYQRAFAISIEKRERDLEDHTPSSSKPQEIGNPGGSGLERRGIAREEAFIRA